MININEVIDPIADLPDSNISIESGGSFNTLAGQTLPGGADTLLDQMLLGEGSYQIEIETSPTHGTLELNSDGRFIYVHDGSDNLEDSFTYKVTNDDGASVSATVNITAEPVFSAAEIQNITDLFSMPVPLTETTPQTDTVETPDEVVQLEEEITETAESIDEPEPMSNQFSGGQVFSATPESANILVDEFNIATEPGINEINTSNPVKIINIEKELLKTLEVRKHNENETIYLTSEANTLSVTSLELIIDVPVTAFEVATNRQFLQGLSNVQDDLDSAEQETQSRYQLGDDVAVSLSISTTAGILAWALRGSALFGSLMAATPLWASIDPLRVAAGTKENGSKDDEVEDIFKS